MNAQAHLKVFNIGIQNTLVYRWNFFIRLLMSFLPLLGLVYFWRAIYTARGDALINGYSYGDMIFYFMLVNLVQALTMPLDDEWQIATDIRDGQLNQFLLKPIDYFTYRVLLFMSNRLVYTVIAILPTLALFIYFREYVSFPEHVLTWVLTIAALLLTAILQFLITYAIAMFAFWILEVSTLVFIYFAFEYIFAGHLFPLDIMPPWMYALVKWTPFPYQLFFPISIFKERVETAQMIEGFGIQILWILLMAVLVRFLWTRGLKKYTAVGG